MTGDCPHARDPGWCVECLRAENAKLLDRLIEANRKWTLYEQEYILPTFDWAAELGIDLQQLVKDNAGKNCVRLLFEAIRADNAALRAKLLEAAERIAKQSELLSRKAEAK